MSNTELSKAMPGARFIAETRDYEQRVHICAATWDPQWIGERGTRAYAAPVVWSPVFYGDPHLGHDFRPTMDLTAKEAQSMMSALWGAGVRPQQLAADPRAEVAAIKYHLEDMRRLAFGTPVLLNQPQQPTLGGTPR
jgi:hypothetical protein